LIVDHLYCKTGFFVGGESIEISAEPILFYRDLKRRPSCRTLKNRMLNKVSNPVSSIGSFREPIR